MTYGTYPLFLYLLVFIPAFPEITDPLSISKKHIMTFGVFLIPDSLLFQNSLVKFTCEVDSYWCNVVTNVFSFLPSVNLYDEAEKIKKGRD